MSSTPTPQHQEQGKFTLDRQDFQRHLLELSSQPATVNGGRRVITAQELIERGVESLPTLVEPIFQQVGIGCLAGSSDTGKSSLLRQLAMAVASGKRTFLDFPLRTRHQSAIYVSTEDEQSGTSFMLNRQSKDGLGTPQPPSRFAGLRFIFDTEELLPLLDAELTAQPADLVVIDAFSDLYGKSLNESNQVRAFLNEYSQLAQRHECLILFLHHTGKRTDDEQPGKHQLLGSQGFEAKMRVVAMLVKDPSDPERRHLCVVKGNYLPHEVKAESFVLYFDEFQNFHFTGERVPLTELQSPKSRNDDRAKYERAKELQNQGYTLAGIADELGYANAGGVSKLLKRYDPPKADVS